MPYKNLTIYPKGRSTITHFVFRRSVKSAVLWALILGAYVASKSIGFAKLYTTHAERVKFASSFGSNSGLSILLGKPHDITTVPGYTAWNCVGIAVIALSIWAILTTTKYLRGEESSGRLELLLSGQTSLKKATRSSILALLTSLVALFLIAGLFFSAIGADKIIGFNALSAFYLSLTMALSALTFMSVSALISQIVSTRTKAVGLSSTIFGIFFLLNAIGDSTKLSWVSSISPLGWIENLRPLAHPQPIWLLPTLALSALLLLLSLFLASKRDYSSSLIKERSETKPNLRLLSTPLSFTYRLSFMSSLGWLIGLTGVSFFYGLLTKPAVQALADSDSTKKAFKKIVSAGAVNSSAVIYVSLTFFITMVILFFFSAYLINHIRSEEAEGRLDNFIVGPVSRLKWLGSRLTYATLAILLTSLLSSIATWIGTLNLHSSSLNLHNLVLAGLNSVPASLLVLAIGVFIFGFIPRLTAAAIYVVIGWSFLIDMLKEGTKLKPWLLDTSLFTHVHLAPASKISWSTNMLLLAIALALAALGAYRFNSRDIQAE
jgi:ABC-2 type transport system permease protein